MRNFFKSIALLITMFAFPSLGDETPSPRIFIMMDLDNIIIDTIPLLKQQSNTSYIDELKQAGFSVQNIEIKTKRSKDTKLDSFLKKTKQDPVALNDSNREKINETIVVRPWIKHLLEELNKFEIPTHILICSKSNNSRAYSIVANLDLTINKIPFQNLVHFVPKESFIVHINSFNGSKITAKSAFELRNHYSSKLGRILPSDYVLLIDKIPDSQFILYNRENDLNIKISPFSIKPGNNYNSDYDQIEMNLTLDKIKKFVNKK